MSCKWSTEGILVVQTAGKGFGVWQCGIRWGHLCGAVEETWGAQIYRQLETAKVWRKMANICVYSARLAYPATNTTIPPLATLRPTKHYYTALAIIEKHCVLECSGRAKPIIPSFVALAPSLRIAFMFTQDRVSIHARSGWRGWFGTGSPNGWHAEALPFEVRIAFNVLQNKETGHFDFAEAKKQRQS